LIKNNKLYAANIGDSKGLIISKNKGWEARKINKKHSANSKKEQKRLKEAFPNDPDIVICKNGNTSCRIRNN
jgi:serine/threonine protein phosphatase PrpC